MQLMDTVDHLITEAEIRLYWGLPVPVDTVAKLLEAGVDYSELERRVKNNANGDTTNGE